MQPSKFYNAAPKGFTLVELLIAMALSSILMTAVITTYQSQQKTYSVEKEVASMQQNIRVAMYYLERDIRLAGCDPRSSAGAGIETADTTTIQFTMDITGGETDGKDNDNNGIVDDSDESSYSDGDTADTDETIIYALSDSDGDGDNDLERNGSLVAQNIDALNFVYLDEDGNVLTTPVSIPSNIRAIQITVVARTDELDPDYTDTLNYHNQQGTVVLSAQNDNYRRRVLTTYIKGRNLTL